MKQRKQEISISNRYFYYYASLIRRLYGFVLRRDGANLPDQRYVGQMDEPPKLEILDPTPTSTPRIRLDEDPNIGEIILFHYRKRLLLGSCYQGPSRARPDISVVSEDGRRLRFRRRNLVCCSGVSMPDDGAFLRTYAGSVRALSTAIDLREIWTLTEGSMEPLPFDDIADLYWNEEPDATQWLALYLHLETGCPYFVSDRSGTYAPQSTHQADARRRAMDKNQQRREERDEFIHWMNDETGHDPESLTRRQRDWLSQIQQYALWGRESERAAAAHALLTEICPNRKNLQLAAFKLMVTKGVWSESQNLDLLRAEIPIAFSDKAVQQAGGVELPQFLKGRKKVKAFVIREDNLPEVALSYKKNLLGGLEFGLHIPDIGSLIAIDSDLDRAAADRMVNVALPDHPLTLLPQKFINCFARFQIRSRRPALSLLWRMNRKGDLRKFAIQPTSVILHTECTAEDVDQARENASHPIHRAISFFTAYLGEESGVDTQSHPPRLQVKDRNGDLEIIPEQNTFAYRMVQKLCNLGSSVAGEWCSEESLPAIYETSDPIHDPERLTQHPHPVVRRHEKDRLGPAMCFSTQPGPNHKFDLDICCPIARPSERYTDLIMQRQISHYLRSGESLYTTDSLNDFGYRMREALPTIEGLVNRRVRDQLLTHWETGREFRVIVLHLKQRGVLVELLDAPFKCVVFPAYSVAVGDELKLRLTGVDRWHNRAHFNVLQPELHSRS